MNKKSWEIVLVVLLVGSLHFVFAGVDVDINLDDTEIDAGNSVDLVFNFDFSSDVEIYEIKISYGDGERKVIRYDSYLSGASFSLTESYVYSDDGNYEIEVEVAYYDENGNSQTESVSEEVEVVEDNLAPEVGIVSPKGNLVIKQDSVSFKFSAEDEDGEVSECALKLYNYSSDEMIYSDSFGDFDGSGSYSYGVNEFDDGYYYWVISCEDDDGDDATSGKGYFQIKTINYKEEAEVAEVLDDIKSFLKKRDNFNLDVEEMLDGLGVFDDLMDYEDELERIDEESVKAGELVDEAAFEKIKGLIPRTVEVVDEEKYIEDFASNLESVVGAYVSAKGLDYGNWKVGRLARKNLEIQNQFSVEVEIYYLKIGYKNFDDDYVFVRKIVEVGEEYDTILEVVSGAEFVSDVEDLGDDVYEVVGSDEILYYFEGDELKEDFQSVLFYDFPSGGITGFVVSATGVVGGWFYFIFVIAIFGGFVVVKNNWVFSSRTWGRDGDIRQVLFWVRNSGGALKRKDYDLARRNYRDIKRNYSGLPGVFQKLVRGKIENIRVALDKVEIAGLVREYERVKGIGEVGLARELYGKIQDKYRRLPKRDQERVYRRVFG